MPIHDWTRVASGIFHDFHQSWTIELKRALNQGRLPEGYYALAEQLAGRIGSDVLTLHGPEDETRLASEPMGGVMLEEAPPQVEFRLKAESDWYAAKANSVVVRHISGHRVVAVLEIISPGNKSNRRGVSKFLRKALKMLRSGVRLLIVDLFPPGPRDPQGIHKLIWDEFVDNEFALPENKRLTWAAYASGSYPEAFVQPVAVGSPLQEMPLFLSPDVYVPAPLEATYQSAWATVPAYWRDVLEGREQRQS